MSSAPASSDTDGSRQQLTRVAVEGVDADADERIKWFKEMRGWLMVVATVAASVTYQAGLNPPGGFWQDDKEGFKPGNPVLRDKIRGRYQTFYYFNSTAFVTSLVIMVLLMSERFYRTEPKVVALMVTTFIDLASLVGAYIAGSTRYMSSCIYVIVIAGVAFLSVIAMGEVMEKVCKFFNRMSPCMAGCFPLPTGVQGRLLPVAGRDGLSAAAKEGEADHRSLSA
uniref:PGG domain-containing protein n=1 Tax=Oryza punctata TaxID=4537 RepID=A0A0E0LAI3_ORYPU